MIVVMPQELLEANLTTSNVPLNDYPMWDVGTAYVSGDRVIYGTCVFEAATSVTGTTPPDGAAADPPSWVRIGHTNRWRMFREGLDSITEIAGGISVEFSTTNLVDALAVLGAVGTSVRVRMVDSVEGLVYDTARDLIDIGVPDWYQFYFSPYGEAPDQVFVDLPPYLNADILIDIATDAPADTSQCGRVVFGQQKPVGVACYGTSVGIIDYSTRERDGFGNLQLVPRRTVRLVNYEVIVDTPLVDSVYRTLAALSATPALYVSPTDSPPSALFGIYRDFTLNIESPTATEATIEVEGF